jgi:hypothetical protein
MKLKNFYVRKFSSRFGRKIKKIRIRYIIVTMLQYYNATVDTSIQFFIKNLKKNTICIDVALKR